MSKKTFGIVSGIIGAVVTCANTIIQLFDTIPAQTAIVDAVSAVGMAAIAVCACFIDSSKQIESK